MKCLFFILSVFFVTGTMSASDSVRVVISDGIDDNDVKSKMEDVMSRILTEANVALEEGRGIKYDGLGIPLDVQGSISALWNNSPFVCIDTEVVEHCITTGSGYQVRNIPLVLKPINPSDIEDGEQYQEAVFSFDRNGNISNFYLAISTNLYMSVIRMNKDVTDLRRRQLILDYVEQFRTSYNQKDLDFLDAVFSDDALIITGKIITRKANDGIRLPDKIVYKKQTKIEYLSNLQRAFVKNKFIRVTFDEIEIVRHPVNQDFYGVTLHQGWISDTYRDDGYLFLLWDFRNEDHPQIHVRTWQPDVYNKDGSGSQPIPKDEIFSLSDFEL